MCQQSPSFGSSPTAATSAHHLVTPTSVFFVPIAHKIAVALGASETILWAFSASVFMLLKSIADAWPRCRSRGRKRSRIDSSLGVCWTSSSHFGGLPCAFPLRCSFLQRPCRFPLLRSLRPPPQKQTLCNTTPQLTT